MSSTLEKNKKLTAALDKKHISKSNLVAALKKEAMGGNFAPNNSKTKAIVPRAFGEHAD